MEKLKQFPAAQKRLVCILLALICMLGLLPSTAFAAGPNTIVMEVCTHNGVYYESAALSTCWLHQMKFDYNGDTVMGFCADHGGGMGWSLEGHEWNNPREITDPTVKTMLAYFYAHSRGIFTDQARALGVDEVWSSDYTWTMNAWVQAVVWRYQENLFSDPVAACAEELLYVYNNLEHTNYTSIDDVVDGTTLRDRAQYILDLGAQGVWGDCKVYEYDYAGPGSAQHPAYDVQSIIIGDLTVTRERYQMTVKKVDATNPNLALPGARFLVQNANGTFSQEVVTGSDGTVTLTNLEASTYSVTELDPPDNYQIDNAGPQYVVLPSATGETTATVTFTDTPIRTGEGSIRKVDADDPTKGLAGAVIKIEGVDNEFVGTYITGAGGYLEDVPWDAMPIGSFVASEVTPPNGYTTSSDPDKVRQEFYWDGKHDVDLIFENDAKVKVQLIKLDDSDDPIEGAVFNVVKDGQVVATEATDADGSIIVPNVTEGMYAFFEVSVPAPYAKLQQPVIAHVDQATVDGGGTVTVTAVDQMLPTLTILKRDGQTGEVVPGAVFEITGIHYGYQMDVTTGPDGTATLTGLPVDSYEVTEISVPDPYVVAAEPTQTIWLGPGDDRQLIFDIFGRPLKGNEKRVLPRIGSLIESPGFYPNLTGTENLQIFARLRGLKSPNYIKSALELVNLPYRDKKRYAQYSLGMKQRLAIALAVMHDPELLILDEPINGLDPIGIAEVRDFIRALCEERGKTILISSHILSEIALLADDIGIIDHGVLLEEESLAELEQKNGKVLRFTVSNAPVAAQLLQQEMGVRDVAVENEQDLTVRDLRLDTGAAVRRFVEAGLVVSDAHLYEDTLEDYFKRITGGEGIA